MSAKPTLETKGSKNGVIISLSVSVWTGRKLDKIITAEVEHSKKAQSGAMTVNKQIVLKPALKQVRDAAAEIRDIYSTMTLPWIKRGERLLPAKNIMKCQQKLDEAITKFNIAVERFLRDYSKSVDDARHFLGDAFNVGDYPNTDSLAKKFGAEYQISPLPESQDFMLSIGNEAEEILKARCDERVQQGIAEANRNLWLRVFTTFEHMHTKLSDPDPKHKFHDSMISGMRDLIDMLPDLNITSDPRLDELAAEAKSKIVSLDESLEAHNAALSKRAKPRELADAIRESSSLKKQASDLGLLMTEKLKPELEARGIETKQVDADSDDALDQFDSAIGDMSAYMGGNK